MYLRRCLDDQAQARWVLDDRESVRSFPLGTHLADLVRAGATWDDRLEPPAPIDWRTRPTLAPVDAYTEVWAAGVTYERSLAARVEESSTADVYDRVYDSERAEIFFKSLGWRVSGTGQPIAVRADSDWNVPEPELAVVLDPAGRVFGWTICNDVSSRSIEAANPLYLPQAKVYLGGCAVGPVIALPAAVPDSSDVRISMSIDRAGAPYWHGATSTALLRRPVSELAEQLFRADAFPNGVILSTGTCLVPGSDFTLEPGDVVRIGIAGIGELVNPVVWGLPPDIQDRIERLRAAGER